MGASGDKVEEKKTEAPEVHLDEDLGENEGMYFHKKLLGGGNSNIFYVHPYLGKMNPFWLIFLQMGWNHQLD